MIDTHVHLDDNRFSDANEIIKSFKNDGIDFVINASCDFCTQSKAIELSKKYDSVFALIGTHPHEARFFDARMEKEMHKLSVDSKVVGVGEIGLDFHYDYSPRDIQKTVFVRQLELANEFNLPVVLHVREAQADTLEILASHKSLLKNGLLFHSYAGSVEMVREFLRFDSFFSFNGAITFKNANKDEIIRSIPIDRILSETDCPYLTPEPFRGTRNEPKNVRFVVQKIADVREKSFSEMENIIKENTLRIFKRILL